MTTLLQETIKGLQVEGKFNMETFGVYSFQCKAKDPGCGTPCCLAGHIVQAAARLDRKLPTESDLRYTVAEGSCAYESEVTKELDRKGLERDSGPTAQAARLVWARAYGVKSANALDFYADSDEMHLDDYGGSMALIPPSAAIKHLNRVVKVK